jgi:hypothetical protein
MHLLISFYLAASLMGMAPYGRSLQGDGGVGDDHGAPQVPVNHCGWAICDDFQP